MSLCSDSNYASDAGLRLISVFVSAQKQAGWRWPVHLLSCFSAAKVCVCACVSHTLDSSIIDVGDEAPQGSSLSLSLSLSFSPAVLGSLLLTFSSPSSSFFLFFFFVFHFALPSPAFHLVHPFTCPLALIHLMCWRSAGGYQFGSSEPLTAKVPFSFTSSSVCPLPVCLRIYICISGQIRPSLPRAQHKTLTLRLAHTHTHTRTHTLCSLSLSCSFPSEDFITPYLGPSPDVKCLPGCLR